MDKARFAARWHELRREVQRQWNRVTDEELDRVHGDPDVLIGILMEKYEEPRRAVELQVKRLTERAPQIGAS